MTENKQWPEWQNVAAGLPVEGAHVCAWPVASYGRPMLALHQQNKPRRLIRVEFGPNSGSVAGYQCFKGTNYLVVYEDEIRAIQAKVPTERQKMLLEIATEKYEEEIARFIKENTRDGRGPTRDEAVKSIATTPWNVYSQNPGCRTGYPKVLSVEVCPEPVPPPETPMSAASHAANAQAEAMGRAMAMALDERDKRDKRQSKAG